MNPDNTAQRHAGMFLLRALLGIIFLMQGFGKVFTWGVPHVYENIFKAYEATWIPLPVLQATAYFTSWMEFLGGGLLLLGLFRRWVYAGLGLVLLMVSFGHGVLQPIWDLQHVFPRAVLLIALYLLPQEWDRWSLDTWITRK